MANLFLTDKCGRGCPFCFAREGPWDEEYPARALTREEVTEFVGIGSLNGRTERGVLGGEPLKYPGIADVLRLMWEKGLTAKVFTSATCPLPDDLASLEIEGGLRFVVNISPWDSYPPSQQGHLDSFLRTFGSCTSLSYTIADPDADMEFLLSYISKYDLSKCLRIGVAMPMVGKANEYLHPDRYGEVSHRLTEFARIAERQGVTFGTDCGFVACMFDSRQIGSLLRNGTDLAFSCRPAVDVGPNLETWHCFPLAKLPRIPLRECRDVGVARERLVQMASAIRGEFGHGIYERCPDCAYRKQGQCDGGCLGLMVPDVETLVQAADRVLGTG